MNTYEINLEIDEQTFNAVSERISRNSNLFINYYGGMGNHVYVKKNTKLVIDEENNCFWYHSQKTKLRINSAAIARTIIPNIFWVPFTTENK